MLLNQGDQAFQDQEALSTGLRTVSRRTRHRRRTAVSQNDHCVRVRQVFHQKSGAIQSFLRDVHILVGLVNEHSL